MVLRASTKGCMRVNRGLPIGNVWDPTCQIGGGEPFVRIILQMETHGASFRMSTRAAAHTDGPKTESLVCAIAFKT